HEYARTVEEIKCLDPYNNVQAEATTKKVFKDVYGLPDTYRWKTEYDSSYNMNPDGTWK
ncbi:hypothetical protein scyTo_0018923, partial [Scyliorhinus torazame]|nr:hypothetical protein [Scyliorhinus torazame]